MFYYCDAIICYSLIVIYSISLQFQYDSISPLNECQTKEAKRLCIFDMAYKSNGQKYDIGGTFAGDTPELHFYYTITTKLYHCYIINLFVFYRSVGAFVLGISNSTKFSTQDINTSDASDYIFLPQELKWKTFRSIVPNESHHIKSYCFSRNDLEIIADKGLCIPIAIDTNPLCLLDIGAVQLIKSNHNLSELLQKDKNFTMISISGRKYEINKIVLLAHSPVLREIVRNTNSNTLMLDIDDSKMEILLEYLYTGTIHDIVPQKHDSIFGVAEQFQLDNLKILQNVICEQMNINNAIDLLVLSEKHNLFNLRREVFTFIKENPAVLDSESWKNLKDLDLTKKIFKELALSQKMQM